MRESDSLLDSIVVSRWDSFLMWQFENVFLFQVWEVVECMPFFSGGSSFSRVWTVSLFFGVK